jgi:PAS domain S-box-containing protein
MRDDEKTKEQLIDELAGLRKQMVQLRSAHGKQRAASAFTEPATAPETISYGETPDIVWSVDDALTPILDDDPEFAEPPRFLHPGVTTSKETGTKEGTPANITETGSFDLSWITKVSFGKLLEAIPMPVLLIDVSGIVQFANHVFLGMTRDTSTIIGASFFTLFPRADEAHQVRSALARIFAERQPQVNEGALHVQGNHLWCRVHFRAVRVGSERSALALLEDLTPERRELTLNEKYKKLVQIFPVGVAEFTLPAPFSADLPIEDAVGRLLNARLTDGNDEFARVNGYENPSRLRGANLGQILPNGDRDVEFCRSWVHSRFSTGQWETKEASASGDLRYFENTLVGNVHDGSIRQFWVMKTDITERKRAEEELVDKLKTIDELYEHIVQIGKAKAIAEHTATVAHELRQPLAIIGGFARRMASRPTSESNEGEQSHKIWSEIIIKEVERLEKILGKLIDFGRHEGVMLQCIDPNDLIQYVIHVHEGRLREKNLRLRLSLEEKVAEVPIDPDRFQQVVRNLLANAIEASPANGIVCVESGVTVPSEKAHKTGQLESGMYFEMKIKNYGTPISADDLERVFDPFFTNKTSGTGLGLTLSKNIIEDHKGSISVKSDEKDGTTFTVWLPMERACDKI